ncbi:hypothetical protein [Sphingomonas alba]|uniref:PRC-barrel domain-containing protein n=1 Tax=Sphingomonas alba TaxID=2908208 RepID=A0ABT0RNK6_9SPHN|nr:hypothetical protein [Sphingomonas alba]MCL6684234.1 hypothetical protein [Sphingomonas alba]
MKRNVILGAAAVAALIAGAPSLAQGASGGSHGGGASATAAGHAGGMGSMAPGPVSAGGMGSGSMTSGMDRATTATSGNTHATAGFGSAMDMRASAQTRRDTARANSQGPAHANVNGLTHANSNSVLSGAGVTTLTGLAAGATVSNTAGTLGTVSSIVTNKSGAVVGINVTLDSGGTVFIPATTLTMNGTAVTTTFVPHG